MFNDIDNIQLNYKMLSVDSHDSEFARNTDRYTHTHVPGCKHFRGVILSTYNEYQSLSIFNKQNKGH